MEHSLLVATEAELVGRLERISGRFTAVKSTAAGSALPSLNQTGIGQYCDDHFQPAIDLVHTHNLLDAYRSFISAFESQLDERAHCQDVPEKVDRLYVDALLRNVEGSVNEHIAAAVTDKYGGIDLEIQDSLDMLWTMREHFVRSIDAFRSELVHFKKKLTDDKRAAADQKANAAARLVGRLPPRSTFLKNNVVAVPRVCRTGSKKRTRPFVPKGLETVIGRAIAPMTPEPDDPVDNEEGSA
jgi:hypothetical protein